MRRSLNLTIALVVLLSAACAPNNTAEQIDDGLMKVKLRAWWRNFNDPLLNQFAKNISKQNLDIKIAQARVQEARAGRDFSNSNLLPEISVSAKGSTNNTNTPKAISTAQAGFDMSWEIDLFGRNSALVEVKQAQLLANIASVQDAQNIVIADLARAYIEWCSAKQIVQKLQAMLEAQRQHINLLASRAEAGLTDNYFLERAKMQYAQTDANIPAVQASIKAAEYQIERLLADRQDIIVKKLQQSKLTRVNVPKVKEVIKMSIATLASRADLRAAYAQVLAANAQIKYAQASLWPRISLAAFFGVQESHSSLPASSLPKNPIWSLALPASISLLNFGKLQANVDIANAQSQQAVLAYENKLNLALQEAKTALAEYLQAINAVNYQQEAVSKTWAMLKITKERFELGLNDMSELLKTQVELEQAKINLINQEAKAAIAYIALQKSLGIASN